MRAAVAIKAIAEPRRQAILRLVWNREVMAGQIAAHFEVSRPAISQHLAVLKQAGLIDERRDGTKRYYRARPEGLAELRAYLEGFWDEGLRQLKKAAEHEEKQRKRRKLKRGV